MQKALRPFTYGIALLAGCLIGSFAGRGPLDSIAAHAEDGNPRPQQKVVVHISRSEGREALHSAMMGFGLATAMQKMGASITVLLDSEGPALLKTDWADKTLGAPGDAPAGGKMPRRTLGGSIEAFLTAGGKIVMCPHCSASCGCRIDDVAKGAEFAKDGQLARTILEADKVLDY